MPREIGSTVSPPLHRPWDPDSSVDFHAARLLILLDVCGKPPGPHIEGRTKLAKLDFFVRYPRFLERAQEELSRSGVTIASPFRALTGEVEAPMIRYRYGPWDNRYRQFLAFLEARKLISVTKGSRIERVKLTAQGSRVSKSIQTAVEFGPIVERCNSMVGNLESMTGTELKELVYEVFPSEVAQLGLWEEIRP